MKELEITQEPNQSFSANLNNHNFQITLRDIGNSMLMDIEVDGKTLISGLPILPNQPLIQYAHLSQYGNFILITKATEYPTWETLGVSSKLYFLTPQEMEAIANG